MSNEASSWTSSVSSTFFKPSSRLLPSHLDSLLLSRHAIPLYLILLVYLLRKLPSLLERLFTPQTTFETSSFVLPAITRHARFLPTPSKHAFHYSTLYLALRLDQLETRHLDTGHAFAWKGPALQPEFVDDSTLAQAHHVTPIGTTPREGDEGLGWKQRMRAAERIERRRLEEKRARNDRYTWSLTGLHPSAYLRNHFPDRVGEKKAQWLSGSILLKLAYELRDRGFLKVGPQDEDTHAVGRGWRDELGHVWTVTMPSVVGLTGINPLTVHYCYRPHGYGTAKAGESTAGEAKRGDFWLVVLEVHNTFSERHIYVLEAGKNEDSLANDEDNATPRTGDTRRGGYDHQWTFPRSFHVSPFNDRGGFYRLFLKEPFSSSSESPPSFVLSVRLLLLVQDAATPSESASKLVKKLMASLDSLPPPSPTAKGSQRVGRYVRPLSPATLYAALLRQPLDLLLTFSRILWQAGKLHFSKRLDAFGRPDMVQLSETTQATFDGVGLPPPINRIQAHRGEGEGEGEGEGKESASVGLVYPEAGWGEKVAKDYVKSLLAKQVDLWARENGQKWSVRIESTDPADEGLRVGSNQDEGKTLVLYTRSYGCYVDLMTHQPRLALLLGSLVGRRWGVNSISLFDQFFAPPSSAPIGIHKRHLDFLLASSSRPQALEILHKFKITTTPTSATVAKTQRDGWKVTTALWMGYLGAVAEKKLFAALGARYVKGTEPWLELDRGLEYLELSMRENEAQWDTRLGSVYHA